MEFQMLNSYLGPGATELGSIDLEHFHHHRMFFWMVLLSTVWLESHYGQIDP